MIKQKERKLECRQFKYSDLHLRQKHLERWAKLLDPEFMSSSEEEKIELERILDVIDEILEAIERKGGVPCFLEVQITS